MVNTWRSYGKMMELGWENYGTMMGKYRTHTRQLREHYGKVMESPPCSMGTPYCLDDTTIQQLINKPGECNRATWVKLMESQNIMPKK